MIFGARPSSPGPLGRWLARALPPQLAAFVLPGAELARAAALDVAEAGLHPVATPRHATVLLIVGALPPSLRQAAAVVFAQMPRPRLIVALAAGDLSPLPEADVVASADQAGLTAAVAQARERLREGTWAEEAAPFEAEGLVPKRRERKRSPQEPAPRASEGGADGGHTGHATAGDNGHGGADHEKMQHAGMNKTIDHGKAGKPGKMDHGDMKQGDMKQDGMDHGGMGMGFMSMVRLTQNLLRSADGLPMERVQAPFGPFFPGLPAGLELTLWLDGDTVAKAQVATGTTSRGLELVGDAEGLPERLARLDRNAPRAYRLLAERALGREAARADDVAALELERAASHLNWLSSFGWLLGNAWLSQQAAAWELRLRREGAAAVASLEPQLLGFLARVRRTPLLSRRLRGLGQLEVGELKGVGGPVARASGLARDARLDDSAYAPLGFAPVIRQGGDALARLEVRLAEVRSSLEMIRATGAGQGAAAPGEASVETPRGAAHLSLDTDGGSVTDAELTTPSQALVTLVEPLAVGLELADALVAVASLDLSPWETAR